MTTKTLLRALVGLLFTALIGMASQPLPPDLQLVSPLDLPTNQGTYFSLQNWDVLPPVPYNWCVGLDNIFYYRSASFGTNKVIIDDTAISPTLSSSSTMTTDTTSPPPPPGGGGGGTDTNTYPKTYFPGFTTNDIWLEISSPITGNIPTTVQLKLHNPKSGLNWQLISKTNIAEVKPWDFGPPIQFSDGTINPLTYSWTNIGQSAMAFFKAVGAVHTVTLNPVDGPVAWEPIPSLGIPGTNASFLISIGEPAESNLNLRVYYSMTGSAAPGIDYSNFPGTMSGSLGSVVLTASQPSATVQVQPLSDGKVDFDETAIFTLVLSNGYVVSPDINSDAITIRDNFGPTNIFQIVATNLPSPVGIEYNASNHSFILPINYNSNDPTFGRVNSTNAAFSTWSGIGGIDLGFEVRITSVPTTTNGLTANDLLFGNGNPGGIGWLSADGSRSNLNWATISGETNKAQTIYVDQTGIWSNDVLVVCGGDNAIDNFGSGPLNIWRVHLRTNFTLVTSIATPHLEGLLTLPVNPSFGPWSGKLLTADEFSHVIFAVDFAGGVSNYFLNIDIDEFRVVTTSDLYCVQFEPNGLANLLKVPASYFRDSQGDILAEQAGEIGSDDPVLFIVHWNGTKFETHGLDLRDYFQDSSWFEKATYAPVSMPSVR